MKIATYNVWNEIKGMGNRFDQLVEEINNVNADIIGLQEVTTHFFNNILKVKQTMSIVSSENMKMKMRDWLF